MGSSLTFVDSVSSIKTAKPLFWYDGYDLSVFAEGAVATTWPDRSGNGHHLTGAASTFSSGAINGLPGLVCGAYASANMAKESGVVSGAYTEFTLFLVSQNVGIQQVYGMPSVVVGGSLYRITTSVNRPPSANDFNAEIVVNNFGSGSTGINGKHRVDVYRPMVVALNYKGSRGTAIQWINGICTDVAELSANFTLTGGVKVGDVYGEANLQINIGALVGFNRALSDGEMRVINRELMERYNIPDRPRVMVIGDSIAEGSSITTADADLFGRLADKFPAFKFENSGDSGRTAQTAVSGDHYPQLYSGLKPLDVVFVWIGSIDIGNGVSAATVEGYITSIVGSIQAKGAKAITVTELPRYNSADGATQTATEAQRILYNTWIVGNSVGADGVVDVCSDTDMGQPGQNSDGTYYADAPNGIHPNNAGYNKLLPLFVAGIRAAYGLS